MGSNTLQRCLYLVILLLALFTATPHVLHAQTPNIEGVIARLEEAANALDIGDHTRAETLLAGLETATLPDGNIIELANRGWDSLLAEPPAVAAASLREFAQRLRDPLTALPLDSRATLENVLARREFQDAQPTIWELLYLQFLRFMEWLADILGLGDVRDQDVRALLDCIIGTAGVIVVGAVLAFLIRMLRRNLAREDDVLPLGGNIPAHATEAQSRAVDAATSGNFREAMRLLYIAALLHLDEVGLLRFDRTLTNREVLASVSHSTVLYTTLSPVVTQFDRVWYGYAPFGETDFEQMRHQIDALRTMKGQR